MSAAELCGPVRFDGNDARGATDRAPRQGRPGRRLRDRRGAGRHDLLDRRFHARRGPRRARIRARRRALAHLPRGRRRDAGRNVGRRVRRGRPHDVRRVRRDRLLGDARAPASLHATVRRNLGKRAAAQAWSFETSAAWQPGEESVAEVLYRHWRRSAPRAPPTRRSTSTTGRRPRCPSSTTTTSSRPPCGTCTGRRRRGSTCRASWPRYATPRPTPKEARRFWLNQPSVAADAWLEPELVTERAAERETRARRRRHARVRRLALRRRYRAHGLHTRRRRRGS